MASFIWQSPPSDFVSAKQKKRRNEVAATKPGKLIVIVTCTTALFIWVAMSETATVCCTVSLSSHSSWVDMVRVSGLEGSYHDPIRDRGA